MPDAAPPNPQEQLIDLDTRALVSRLKANGAGGMWERAGSDVAITFRDFGEALGQDRERMRRSPSTSDEIDAALARLAHDRGDDVYANDVLFVSGDALFQSRSQQLVALTARDKIPAAYPVRATVAAGGLMS